MSSSLCKRGLEVLEEGTNKKTSIGRVTKKKKENTNKFHKNPFDSKKKSAFELYEKYSLNDKTEENLKVLKRIDKKFSKEGNSVKVKEHHLNQLQKRLLLETDKCAKQTISDSVFSEEDFERINNEWLALM